MSDNSCSSSKMTLILLMAMIVMIIADICGGVRMAKLAGDVDRPTFGWNSVGYFLMAIADGFVLTALLREFFSSDLCHSPFLRRFGYTGGNGKIAPAKFFEIFSGRSLFEKLVALCLLIWFIVSSFHLFALAFSNLDLFGAVMIFLRIIMIYFLLKSAVFSGCSQSCSVNIVPAQLSARRDAPAKSKPVAEPAVVGGARLGDIAAAV
jgi:hypothetical protein